MNTGLNYMTQLDVNTANTEEQNHLRYFDHLIILLLLFYGWSGEWTWGRQEGFLGLFLIYSSLAAFPAFCCYYYFKNKGAVRINLIGTAGISAGLLLAAFAVICLVERSESDLEQIWYVWKEYYYLAMLPAWWILGFVIADDMSRMKNFFNSLAKIGALLSYISFAMQTVGFSSESWLGPMYWPFRFIVIFSFFYFLTLVIACRDWKKSDLFWLMGSAIAVFWGFYKFTIISTALGMIGWGIFIMLKWPSARGKVVFRLLAMAVIAFIVVNAVNSITGGALFNEIDEIYNEKWVHYADQYDTGSDEWMEQLSGGRYYMWMYTLDRVGRNWWVGTGLGQHFDGYIVNHNGYLDILTSFGILGSIVFLLLLLLWIVKLIMMRPPPDIIMLQAAYIGYFCTILAANMFGSVWIQFHTISFYIMLLGGILYRLSVNVKPVEGAK